MKISIITNTYKKYNRQNVAVDSWKYLRELFPTTVDIINLQFKDEQDTFSDSYSDIRTEFVLEKSSQTLMPSATKKLPLIFELISKGFEYSDSDYVVYVNSDVILLPRLIEYIASTEIDCMAGPRLDIQEIDSFEAVLQNKIDVVRMEIAGYDFFVFKRSWFEKYKEHFDCEFLIGKPFFDVIYAGLMVVFGEKFHIANQYPVMALHMHHGIDSVTTECEERTHNLNVFNSKLLFKLVDNIMYYNLQYNLCKRTPWGAFIKPQENEESIQTNFFNSMNIHSDNNIRHIP